MGEAGVRTTGQAAAVTVVVVVVAVEAEAVVGAVHSRFVSTALAATERIRSTSKNFAIRQ